MTVVYTDGACSGNPGPGGWAWVVPDGAFASGAAARTTNQRMEITAAHEAVAAHEGDVEVVSDSTYVVNCFRDGWWRGWQQRGWINAKKQPVANRDLWEPLIDLVNERGGVTFRWVKGHSGDRWNDLADALAVEATKAQQGRSGDGPPEVDPAQPSAGGGGGDRPVGHLVVVAGHRPPELGGYGPNRTAAAVEARLTEIIAAKRSMTDDLAVVSGLSLGAEQLGASAATAAGVPYVAVQPFPEPDAPWPPDSRSAYRDLLDGAREVVLLERRTPESKPKVRGALQRRDAWLADVADEAVVVWDGRDALVGRTVQTLQGRLGEEDVWIVDPGELATG